MEPIYIPQLLKAPDQTLVVPIQDYLPDLETLTPVQGYVRVAHRGNYLEITSEAEAIITLTCHRCLQNYNFRLQVSPHEMIWLEEPDVLAGMDMLEREVTVENLVETLPPEGHFDPHGWLYEQLCLAMPQRQICDEQCQGIQLTSPQPGEGAAIDRRWASLASLKHLLNDESN